MSSLDPGREDWALERESEIARLETENEELRKLLGIDNAGASLVGATEEDWSSADGGERRRAQHTSIGSLRSSASSGGMGRKPSSMGRGGSPMQLNPYALQRSGSMGWQSNDRQEGLLSR